MADKKKEYFKPGPMTEGKRNIIQGLLQEYDMLWNVGRDKSIGTGSTDMDNVK